jgi:Protein of unknown function (DUF1203)
MLVVMTTDTRCRADFEVRAIPADVIRELLVRDDAGRSPQPYVDTEGGSPLRCCLRRIRPGERVALVSYAPLHRWARATGAEPGPYDEVGPVFVHTEPCAGPDGSGCPGWLTEGRRVLRAYDAAGRILGGRLMEADPGSGPVVTESALAEMLADPGVAVVHGRAVEFGCFLFEARRVGEWPAGTDMG